MGSAMGTDLEYVDCNLCGSKDSSPFLRSPKVGGNERTFSATSQTASGERIVRCKDCGLIYVNPRLPARLIVEGYSQGEEEAYIKGAKARTISFKRSLGIVRECKDSGTLLDVGCAAGLFLKVAEDAGFEVCGVEPNKWLADWGRKNLGLNITPESFEETDLPEKAFEVVTFWDVLEHLADPFSALQKANRIMKKDGVIVVNYPDIGSFLARAFGRNWWFVISGHLFYFTSDTISKVLVRAGFEVIENRPHLPTLSLPHLLSRLERYNSKLAGSLSRASESLGLGRFLVPYYAGQRMVVARKVST